MEWRDQGLALLPLGTLFSAVRLPGPLVRALAASVDPEDIDAFLGEALKGGPVIHGPEGRRYYALVPPGTTLDWRAPAAACLGDGTYLGVPRTDLTELEAHASGSYWAVPFTRPGWLCKTADVLALVTVAGGLAREDGSEEKS
ncbi:hypothetical protein ACFVOK_29285 [Streptomyces sp. NPDC057798]|uniref:hypothetical protein n=1 Tax=Streptomyces sp. NPDC057798 TaxID=3346252 RepID=UPI0036CCE4E8